LYSFFGAVEDAPGPSGRGAGQCTLHVLPCGARRVTMVAMSVVASYPQRQTDRSRATIMDALGMLHGGRVPPEQGLVHTARQHADFAQSWLAHALGSAAGVAELALVVALARRHRDPCLDGLARLWAGFPDPVAALPDDAFERVTRHGLDWHDGDTALLKCWAALEDFDSAPRHATPVGQTPLPMAPDWLDWLREFCLPLLQPASVYGQQAGERHQQVRDSDQALMPLPSFHPLSASIERLIAASCGRTLAGAEPLVVLRYRPGQQYRWHRDYFQPGTPATNREIETFGQRVYTGILYLNDRFTGGETEFRDWGLSLRAPPGTVVHFAGVDAHGHPDPASIHRGVPVEAGEKWIATLWFRDRALWNRRGLLLD